MGYDYTKGHLSESRIVADDTDFADFWHRLLVCAGLTKTKPATIRKNTPLTLTARQHAQM